MEARTRIRKYGHVVGPTLAWTWRAVALAAAAHAPAASGQPGLKTAFVERGGAQVVEEQCAKCHAEGVNAAPRIGDRAAWTPRLKSGIENLVQSAIHGHGGMPPRGGQADLTDRELRSAILHMFDPRPSAGVPHGGPLRRAAAAGPNERLAGGLRILLGYTPAEALRRFPEGSVERTMHGGVPAGARYQHLNVSVIDRASGAPVPDAEVEVRIEQLGLGGQTKALRPMALGAASYGGYVRVVQGTPYEITVRVRPAGAASAVSARFEHTFF